MKYLHFIPIFTTLFSIYFLSVIFPHWKSKPSAMHLFWWMLGVFFFGAGTVTESVNTLFGYSDLNFRLWYIFGALLGGAPLAQGTVYLLMKPKNARILSRILVSIILFASVCVFLSPLHPENREGMRMSGKILDWTFIRYITPFINTYGLIFLVGGAIYSAIKYHRLSAPNSQDSKGRVSSVDNSLKVRYRTRYIGNIFIAVGGLLPGIGGSFTKFGYVEVLYVTEFLGLICIYTGYTIIRNEQTVRSVTASL